MRRINRLLNHPAYRRAIVFLTGAFGYGLIEIAWRGRTHISMLLLGGACLLCLMKIEKQSLPLWAKCAFGAAAITGLEFVTGLVVNLWLGLAVWDYSANRLNLWGQICPSYTALWYLLCLMIYAVHAFAAAILRYLAFRICDETIPLLERARAKELGGRKTA